MPSTDWIKIKKSLVRDGRVRKASRSCNVTPLHYVGALVVLWSLADDFADDDGRLPGWSTTDLDVEIGVPGFVESLPTEWMRREIANDFADDLLTETLYLPNYKEHNGSTAKARAQSARRAAKSRSAIVTQDRYKKRTESRVEEKRVEESRVEESRGEEIREESRVEEKTKTGEKAPASLVLEYSHDFMVFWNAYPKRRRINKRKAFEAWKAALARGYSANVIIEAAIEYAASAEGQGEFCPGPTPWINGNRWEDDRTPWNTRETSQRERVNVSAANEAKRILSEAASDYEDRRPALIPTPNVQASNDDTVTATAMEIMEDRLKKMREDMRTINTDPPESEGVPF